MTLRARPVARRRGRAGWDSGDRRNSLINAGFFLAIGISILILIGYAAWSWYDDHFGAAATVNGQVVTKDDVRNRARIEGFRLNYVSQRINTLMAKGRITQADGQQQLQFITQRQNQLASLTVHRQGHRAAKDDIEDVPLLVDVLDRALPRRPLEQGRVEVGARGAPHRAARHGGQPCRLSSIRRVR